MPPEVTTEGITSDPNSEDHSQDNHQQQQEDDFADLKDYQAEDGTIDPAKLAAAYRQLRDGQQRDNPEGERPEGEGQGDDRGDEGEQPDGTTERAEAANLLADKGVDLPALEKAFAENGKLSDEEYETLNKAGFPRDLVDNYIAGQQARADNYRAAIYDAAGGEASFAELNAWATENLNPAEITAINKVLASGDADGARFAIEGLAARAGHSVSRDDHDAASVGTMDETGFTTFIQPSRNPGLSGRGAGEAFTSEHAMVKAMQDPRYGVDPEYTDMVATKTVNMT